MYSNKVTSIIKTSALLLILLLQSCGGGSDSPNTTTDPIITDGTSNSSVADANFTSAHFSGSENCALCHNGIQSSTGEDVSIETAWSSSMMANSTRDPFWLAKVSSELERNPQLKEVIDDKCTRCHAPIANVEAKFSGAAVELFGEGFVNPNNEFFNHSSDGVSCTVCHQIEDDGNLGTQQGFSGHFNIIDLGVSGERTAYGQYQNPSINPMLMNTGFRPTYSEHISTSEVCATCHNLKTPFVDSDGVIASTDIESEFPEQMIYSEWEQSVYATVAEQQSCQDCHMPSVDGVRISNRPINLAARNDFSKHTLIGANSTMLEILDSNREELGVTANGFDEAIAQTRLMLESSADIEVLNQQIFNQELVVQLRITNNTGHKLPGGYPSRRVFIHFTVNDSAGVDLFESGKMNADGSIVGADGDQDLLSYEPHYEEITSQDQVQIYGTVMVNTDDEVTYTLLRAASYVKDNRLTPAGFAKLTVPADVRVAGLAFEDDDFNLGFDVITYRIPIGDASNVSFKAELKYQTLAYGFIKDLFLDNNNAEVAKFETMYNNAAIRAEMISVVEGTVN